MQQQGLFLADFIVVIRLYSQCQKVSFFSQFSEENSQFQVLKNFENKSSICLVKVGLKMYVQHEYSGFPITKISGVNHFSTNGCYPSCINLTCRLIIRAQGCYVL